MILTHTHPAFEALSREKTDLRGTEEHERDDGRVVVAQHLASHLDQRAAEVVAVDFDLLQLLLAFECTRVLRDESRWGMHMGG